MSAIAIFVKTPGLSPVKSRLAKTIGLAQAEDCHLRCAHSVAAVARSAAVGPVYWAIAEPEAHDHPAWRNLPVLIQPDGGLGVRMQAIHDTLVQRHGSSMLLGADLPQVDQACLQAASDWLQGAPRRVVIGPAQDGGFWLIGANASLPRPAWQAPNYGTDRVCQDFIDALDHALALRQLGARTDLDRLEDVRAVIHELDALACPHPDQQRLLHWLRTTIDPQHSSTAKP